MPHLVLRGTVDLTALGGRLDARVDRWGRAVIKTGDRWCRSDGEAVLVDGVVVELSRPLHPVAMIARRDDSLVVRLWPVVEVERTPAVQRWLGILAAAVQRTGGGPVVTTNIDSDILDGLDLAIESE